MGKYTKQLQSELSLDKLVADIRTKFDKIADYRGSNSQYALSDVLLSGLAMFSLKQSSLLEFETQTTAARANLEKVFKIRKLISDSGFRKVLDGLDWSVFKGLFKPYYQRLKRQGILKDYTYLENYKLVSIDGVEHFNSQKVHCSCCLERRLSNGTTQYHHHFLGAVLVHPEAREVFPLGGEPIQKQDGEAKNDCELAAVKRLLADLHTHYGGEKFIFLQDALFANGPQVARLQSYAWDFIINVKPDSHKSLFKSFETRMKNQSLLHSHQCQVQKYTYQFHWMNQVALNESHPDLRVNFLHCREIDPQGNEKIFTWVTSLPITKGNVRQIMAAGRSRWKIENETFNTLKNQGYHFEHNYGHGYQNLSTVLVYLMFLAFLFDQIVQRTSRAFQMLWQAARTKKKLWGLIRGLFESQIFESFYAIYLQIAQLLRVQLEE
jgi:hypothetical protein